MNFEGYTYEEVCQVLSPMLTEERKEKIEKALSMRCQNIQVAMESPSDVHNAYAIARTGEAFGLYQFHVIASEIKIKRPKSMVGVHRWVKINHHENLADYKEMLGNVKIIGADVNGKLPLGELDPREPMCLLFGNEHRGLSEKALGMCDQTFRLPMVGMVESLNLSVSAAITLFTLRSKVGFEGDATEKEIMRLRALYYYKTWGHRALPGRL